MAESSLAERERSGIYEIVNTIDGKRYIGSAKCFRIRFRVHKGLLTKGKHHAPHLQHAWSKHGADAFEFRVIRFCGLERLIELEQTVIDELKPEYNVCPKAGSTLGRAHSAETRQKIAEKAAGRKFAPRSAEHCAALSAGLKGKKKSESHAAAFQAGRAARVYSAEHRAKVSESLRHAYETGARSREKTEQHRHNIGRAYAKLSEEQVRKIRSLTTMGVTCRELAERFGSNASTISGIANRKRYRWVE